MSAVETRTASVVFGAAKRMLVGSPVDGIVRRCYYGLRKYWQRDEDLPSLDDRLTVELMRRVLSTDSHCVDVGANAGYFLGRMVEFAPEGTHFAFEPIPWMAQDLRRRFGARKRTKIYECALSDVTGPVRFHHNIDRPAYSSLLPDPKHERSDRIRSIEVSASRLDDIVTAASKIAFIKIDVEGAELSVLRGAEGIIRRDRPTIVFEFWRTKDADSASRPALFYEFFARCNYEVRALAGAIDGFPGLALPRFQEMYDVGEAMYFAATPVGTCV